jgi:aspartate ammonia-lyase
VATALNPWIGYAQASAIAQEAHRTGRRVRDLVLERGLLEADQLDRILSPEGLVHPRLRDNV